MAKRQRTNALNESEFNGHTERGSGAHLVHAALHLPNTHADVFKML